MMGPSIFLPTRDRGGVQLHCLLADEDPFTGAMEAPSAFARTTGEETYLARQLGEVETVFIPAFIKKKAEG
jgi:hypothetical protein